MTTEDRVRLVVVERLGALPQQVKSETNFADDLAADSLDIAELMIALEEEFGIEISDDDAESINTYQDAVNCITRAVG